MSDKVWDQVQNHLKRARENTAEAQVAATKATEKMTRLAERWARIAMTKRALTS